MLPGTQVPQERKFAPAEALPAELLDHIFHYVHEDFKAISINQEFEHGLTRPEIRNFNEEDNPYGVAEHDRLEVAKFVTIQPAVVTASALPQLFPYALAAVCPSWESALSLSPEFWTRLVLFINPNPVSLNRARKYLAWSRQLPIDIFLHHEGIAGMPTEREVLGALLDILRPHMSRCRSLHIAAFLDISLPALQVIPQDANALRSICIRSVIGNIVSEEDQGSDGCESGGERDVEMLNEISEGSLRLHTLKVDSRTFQRAYKNPPSWLYHQPQLRYLDIEEHACSPTRLSLGATLQTISNALSQSLTAIMMRRLAFDIDTKAIPPETFELDHVHALFFRDMEAKAISEFFRATMMTQLTTLCFHSCFDLSPRIFRNVESQVNVLMLNNYGMKSDPSNESKDDRPSDLIDFLSGWAGIVLVLTNSDMCLDELMEEVSQVGYNSYYPSDLMCHYMRELILDHCRTPSFESVKTMIEVRNASINYDNPLWRLQHYAAPVIVNISLINCQPTWTEEEMEWVRTRVRDFHVT